MRRRRVLRALSLAVAGLAGCTTGPGKSEPKWGPPETEPATPTEDESTLTTTTAPGYGLETDFTYETTTEPDSFALTVTVTNTVDVQRSAVLVVTWEGEDETQEETRQVDLAPGESDEFEFRFPAVGDLSFDWREA